ncbi:MAG: DUF2384 domain-containing protein [Verrucomicrobia bacterium]|nr:DUF2384 domain-containing protein [Verrucomicrobiota bacterium]
MPETNTNLAGEGPSQAHHPAELESVLNPPRKAVKRHAVKKAASKPKAGKKPGARKAWPRKKAPAKKAAPKAKAAKKPAARYAPPVKKAAAKKAAPAMKAAPKAKAAKKPAAKKAAPKAKAAKKPAARYGPPAKKAAAKKAAPAKKAAAKPSACAVMTFPKVAAAPAKASRMPAVKGGGLGGPRADFRSVFRSLGSGPKPTPSPKRNLAARPRAQAVKMPDSRLPHQHLMAELCDAASGRLNARLIAGAFGLSMSDLARQAAKTPQAVSLTPDAQALQGLLRPYARIRSLLSFAPSDRFKAWLNWPNPALAGATPLALIQAGKVELVAGLAEDVVLGHPS